jgi:hypothetical protein
VVDESLRLSDADREKAVALLRDHLLAGRLTLDEFSERVEMAYAARFGQDLVRIQEGFPEPAEAPAPSRRKPTRVTLSLFGHVVRRGRLRLRRRTVALGTFADIDLDLREAEIDRPETTVIVLALFSNTDIYVPEGVNVDIGGITVFGHSREWGRDLARPDAPTIHVRTVGCWGTIDLWRVPNDMRGSYKEIIRQLHPRPRS